MSTGLCRFIIMRSVAGPSSGRQRGCGLLAQTDATGLLCQTIAGLSTSGIACTPALRSLPRNYPG